MSRLGFALCAILTLGGCAHSSLVLLPDEDGGHGAVAVLSPDGGETVVSEANSRSRLATTIPPPLSSLQTARRLAPGLSSARMA